MLQRGVLSLLQAMHAHGHPEWGIEGNAGITLIVLLGAAGSWRWPTRRWVRGRPC